MNRDSGIFVNSLLYSIFIGRNRGNGGFFRRKVQTHEIIKVRQKIEGKLRSFGRVTVKLLEGVGKGPDWKPERAIIILCVMEKNRENQADVVFGREIPGICNILDQDAILVTKQSVDKFDALREQ